MIKTPLCEYLKKKRQQDLADVFGFRQSAISNMVCSDRKISVVVNDQGLLELHEEKIIAVQKAPSEQDQASGKAA